MKIRMLRDWGWHKQGDVVDIFDVTAKAWISDGIAAPAEESRSIKVEQATVSVERRKVKP